MTATAICLPAWVLLQWLPLPLGMVEILSPARAALAHSLEPVLGSRRFASLSVAPAVTLTHFLLLCGYAVLMFAAREFAVRARRRVWILAAPVLVGGLLEAALAMVQFTSGGDNPGGKARFKGSGTTLPDFWKWRCRWLWDSEWPRLTACETTKMAAGPTGCASGAGWRLPRSRSPRAC